MVVFPVPGFPQNIMCGGSCASHSMPSSFLRACSSIPFSNANSCCFNDACPTTEPKASDKSNTPESPLLAGLLLLRRLFLSLAAEEDEGGCPFRALVGVFNDADVDAGAESRRLLPPPLPSVLPPRLLRSPTVGDAFLCWLLLLLLLLRPVVDRRVVAVVVDDAAAEKGFARNDFEEDASEGLKVHSSLKAFRMSSPPPPPPPLEAALGPATASAGIECLNEEGEGERTGRGGGGGE
mmetsp:Transcript_7366/g.13799  ORF Transcript_7366/g.13799 Transcript_7366/m.13799 type:complete len:237 (-) Transcript_7366:97-807(-)